MVAQRVEAKSLRLVKWFMTAPGLSGFLMHQPDVRLRLYKKIVPTRPFVANALPACDCKEYNRDQNRYRTAPI